MIRVIIIDDEKHCLHTLAYQLEKAGGVELLASIQDSTTAEVQIRQLQPDIVFIDVQMPHMNGFEVLQRFDILPFKVVFTTAYDQYAVKALKMNALDYLQKPIAIEEVNEVLVKYKNGQMQQQPEQVSQMYRFSQGYAPETIALSVQEGLVFVKPEDILYIEGSGSYSRLKMADGSQHLVSKTISVFEEVLQDNTLFFRAHKSYMVNLKSIRKYIRGEGGEMIMSDGNSIPVSRNRKQEFLSLFQKI